MAARIPDIGGLQQHHKKEQGALRHDRGGGAENQAVEKERIKNGDVQA